MIQFRAFAFSIFLLGFAAAAANAADLTITVKDVRNASGSIFVAVYDTRSSFMKLDLAKAKQKAKASPGEVTFTIHNLPTAKYAVSAYHDENGNGKLDKSLFGKPTEGYGFSNDARGTTGPPKFAPAAFDFDGETGKAISFSLNY